MSANSRFLNLDTDGTLSANSDEIVPSQKAIKTYVDSNSGGSVDNKSITKNSSNQLQAVALINQRDATSATKEWIGTKAQYDAITTKDPNTRYITTDEEEEANPSYPRIIETYHSGTSWYRVWSDGWCEQGALQIGSGEAGYTTVTLLKEMSDTNYTITALTKYKFAWCCEATDGTKSTTQFSIYTVDTSTQGYCRDFYWRVSGYVA